MTKVEQAKQAIKRGESLGQFLRSKDIFPCHSLCDLRYYTAAYFEARAELILENDPSVAQN